MRVTINELKWLVKEAVDQHAADSYYEAIDSCIKTLESQRTADLSLRDLDYDRVLEILVKMRKRALATRRAYRHDPRLGGQPSVRSKQRQQRASQ